MCRAADWVPDVSCLACCRQTLFVVWENNCCFFCLAGCATGVRGRGRYARLPASSHVAAACCAVSHQPLGSMVLAFHLAKVVKREGKNSAQLSLRFKQGAEADGLTASEPLLAAFAFPFGAEAVVPKERIASEVRASHAGGSSPSTVRLFQPPPPTPWAAVHGCPCCLPELSMQPGSHSLLCTLLCCLLTGVHVHADARRWLQVSGLLPAGAAACAQAWQQAALPMGAVHGVQVPMELLLLHGAPGTAWHAQLLACLTDKGCLRALALCCPFPATLLLLATAGSFDVLPALSAVCEQVLQTIEQLLRLDESLDTDLPKLPAGCQALTFLEDLAFQLDPDPEPGAIIRVPLPNASKVLGTSPSATLQNRGTSLYNDDWMQLPVPADCGNGKRNCGIGLARLLWNVPVPGMLTLIAAMLLERRVVMTSRSRDTLTASVQAAAAMLYPFQYHHIFLPLLPKMLSDYLQAPMPFLVGLPDQMLGILRGMQGMEEVTLVDLDQGARLDQGLKEHDGAKLCSFVGQSGMLRGGQGRQGLAKGGAVGAGSTRQWEAISGEQPAFLAQGACNNCSLQGRRWLLATCSHVQGSTASVLHFALLPLGSTGLHAADALP